MPDKAQSLELMHQAPPPPAIRGASSVAQMLQAVVEKGVTNENVEAMKSLVALYEHMQQVDAKQAFAEAFQQLQSEMPRVKARQPVPDKHGGVKYRYAPYEEIMEQVRPLLLKHGFTVDFTTRYDEGPPVRLVKICIMTHKQGHEKRTEFGVRIGQGPYGATETQADGAAGTYAKRFALCDALNIVIEKDHDANLEGGTITPEKAKEIETRLANIQGDRAGFLKLGGVSKFEDLSEAKLEVLEQMLVGKERAYMAKLGAK